MSETDAENGRTATPLEPGLALVTICVGVMLALFAEQLLVGSDFSFERRFMTLEPTVFPRVVGALLVVFGGSYVLQWLSADGIRRLAIPTLGPLARPFVALGLLFAYATLIPALGYGWATAVIVFTASYWMGIGSLFGAAVYALIATIVIRFIFERVLLVGLPQARIAPLRDAENAVMSFLSAVLNAVFLTA